VDPPVLPDKIPPFKLERDTFRLGDIDRFQPFSELEIRFILGQLFGQVVVRLHGREDSVSLFGGFVGLERGRSVGRIDMGEIDREAFSSIRVWTSEYKSVERPSQGNSEAGHTDNGDHVQRMTVKVIIRSQLGEQETLLQSPAGESLVNSNAPSYRPARKVSNPNPFAAMSDAEVLLTVYITVLRLDVDLGQSCNDLLVRSTNLLGPQELFYL
jgi:hypothetical protein